MGEAVGNLALETLRDLLVEETKFLLSVKGDVKKVGEDLEIIHGLLRRADRERSDSPTLKEYIKQLNDLAFKAETVLETYDVEVESKKEDSRKSLKQKLRRYMCIMCECSTVHEVGNDLRDIISRLADIKTNLESELGQQSGSSSSHNDHLLRQTYGHEVEPHFVGMEKDIKSIVSMLAKGEEEEMRRQQRVVKMYGMGGLGKTTLATKIYNHQQVVGSYGTRAWVCISQQFEATTVLRNISKQVGANIAESGSVGELVVGIHKYLGEKEKKCLIVMDDIWENEHWEIIKPAFPIKSCDVLLTTRDDRIAANHEGHIPYKLELLTEDEGWELLQKIAFPKDLAPPPTEDQGSELRLQKIAASKDLATPVETSSKSLEDIGREIVVKCGRLPLSISVIGGILRQKEQNLGEWEKVSLHMDSYLRHGEGVTENKRVTHVLSLSYDALPYYLKPCFLYLACFPEDAQIETEKLYLLWMAEDFISSQDKGRNESLRDVAERYLTELAMRCMVQLYKDEESFIFGMFDSCGLHDLMHDLCSAKAQEVKLAKRIELSKYKNAIPSSINKITIPSSVINDSVSRLAIIVDSTAQTPSVDGLSEVKSLRSFMVLSKFEGIRFTDYTIDFERSKCLRILVLDNCEFEGEKLPSKVSKLIHLRYLSLATSNVKELPEFVCNLPYLHTLDLRHVPIRLPNVIWKMKRLRHLFLPLRGIEVIEGDHKLRLDGLVELETLDQISSESARIVDILEMVNLRKLVVTVNDMDSLRKVVQHMTNNKSCQTELYVQSCDLSSDIDKDTFMDMLMSPSLVRLSINRCNVSGGFPLYKAGMCQNLLYLSLIRVEVFVKMIEEFGNYPKLQYLFISGVDISGVEIMGETETLICRSNSFPQLKDLYLYVLPNLKKWQVEERALPKLTLLSIFRCSNLEKLPDGLISTLERLEISSMPEEFKERVRGEDNANISHIPSIIF